MLDSDNSEFVESVVTPNLVDSLALQTSLCSADDSGSALMSRGGTVLVIEDVHADSFCKLPERFPHLTSAGIPRVDAGILLCSSRIRGQPDL